MTTRREACSEKTPQGDRLSFPVPRLIVCGGCEHGPSDGPFHAGQPQHSETLHSTAPAEKQDLTDVTDASRDGAILGRPWEGSGKVGPSLDRRGIGWLAPLDQFSAVPVSRCRRNRD